MADQVTLKLAHPLTAEQVARLRATDVGDRNIGDTITVPREEALAIINSGYALGVDPGDLEAVRSAMADGRGPADAPPTESAAPVATANAPAPADSGRGAKKTDGGR